MAAAVEGELEFVAVDRGFDARFWARYHSADGDIVLRDVRFAAVGGEWVTHCYAD